MNKLPAFLAAAAVTFFLVGAGHDPSQRPPYGLNLFVPFNTGDAKDLSPYNATPTLVGNAVVTAGQRYLTLDGDDHARYPDSDNHSFTVAGQDQPFSAGGWVYLNSNTTSNKSIMYKGMGSPLALEWAIKCANGTANDPTFVLFNPGVTQYIGRRTGSAIPTGQWVHVFGTYSGNESPTGIKVYVNGVQADTANINTGSYTGMSNTAAPLLIGGSDVDEYINGLVDDPRVYFYALSAAEVSKLYSAGRP